MPDIIEVIPSDVPQFDPELATEEGRYVGRRKGIDRDIPLVLENDTWYQPRGIGGRSEIAKEDIISVRVGNWIRK